MTNRCLTVYSILVVLVKMFLGEGEWIAQIVVALANNANTYCHSRARHAEEQAKYQTVNLIELWIGQVDVNPRVAHAPVGAPLADAIAARRDLVDGLGERAEPVDAAAEHLDLDMARARAADLAPQFFAEVDAVVIVAAHHHPSLII